MTTDLHQLAPLFAIDALEATELTQFELHLSTCVTCTAEVAELRQVVAEFSDATASEPPASLRATVLSAIARTPQLDADRKAGSELDRASLDRDVSHTPLASNVIEPVSGQVASLADARNKRRRRLSAPLAAAAAVLMLVAVFGLSRGPGDTDVISEVVSAPDAIVTELAPASAAGDAMLEIVWSADRDQVVVRGSGLSELTPEQEYQIWFLVDGGAIGSATFVVENGAVNTVLDVEDRDTGGWGITIEPVGGSDVPTSPVIFSASM